MDVPLLNGRPLYSWTMVGFPFENTSWVFNVPPSTAQVDPPAFYGGEFMLPSGATPHDTYIDPTGWGKVNNKAIICFQQNSLVSTAEVSPIQV